MELRNLLELLYTARTRFVSIQVMWQYHYHAGLMQEAYKQWASQHPSGSVSSLQSASGREGRTDRETTTTINRRVWWLKPFCWRDEEQREGHGRTIRIRCNGRWWLFNSASKKLYTNVPPGKNHLHIQKSSRAPIPALEELVRDVPLIDPSFLLASHELQVVDETVHAQREATRVRATPRKSRGVSWDPFFWTAADAFEFLVDKERGVLLRYVASLKDEEFAVASVDEVIFDQKIAEDVFFFTPPTDASVELGIL